MDFLNTLLAQVRDLFHSMTPGARITAGLLLAVVVVSLAFLFQQGTSATDAYLFGGEPFSRSQIARMEAAIAEAGLNGWTVEGNRIRIPSDQKDAYIAAIASAGAMPPDFSSLMNDALSQASPLESRRQFELRTKAARESQFSHLISLMPWVEQANVMFDISTHRTIGRKSDASASVFVVPVAGEAVTKKRARHLKQFVAGAMASLTVDDVHITGGGESFTSDEIDFDDPYLQAREELQRSYRQRIIDGLEYIPGVQVEVTAEVDNLANRKRFEARPESSVTARETTEEERVTSTMADGGGRPGQVANSAQANGRTTTATRENRSQTERLTNDLENVVGQVNVEEHYVGWKPKEVYASIAIPRDYVVKIWQQKNPDTTLDDLSPAAMETEETTLRTNVEEFVQNILPRLSIGENEFKQVKVVYYDALDQPVQPEPGLSEKALAWAGRYWNTLTMVGLTLVSLLMLRSVVKPTRDTPPLGHQQGVALQLETGSRADDEDEEEDQEPGRPRLRLKKGESLKDDLSEMVRENPDGAAAILRAWIDNAG